MPMKIFMVCLCFHDNFICNSEMGEVAVKKRVPDYLDGHLPHNFNAHIYFYYSAGIKSRERYQLEAKRDTI